MEKDAWRALVEEFNSTEQTNQINNDVATQELDPFMTHKDAYVLLVNALFPFARYIKTKSIINEFTDSEKEATTIPPIKLARKLDGIDMRWVVPEPIFKFLEKAYKDAYYQLKDIWASYYLARLYYYDHYGNVDYKEAVKYLKLESHTLAPSTALLGKCYYLGTGVEKDYEKAFMLFVQCAPLGTQPETTYLLGDMYKYGHFVEQDILQANVLYEAAYDQYIANDDDVPGELFMRLGDVYLSQEENDDDFGYRRALHLYQRAENDFYHQLDEQCKCAKENLELAVIAQENARQKIAAKRLSMELEE